MKCNKTLTNKTINRKLFGELHNRIEQLEQEAEKCVGDDTA